MLRSPVSGSTAFSHAAFFPGQSFWAAADPQRCLQHRDRLRCSRSSNNQLGAGAGGCTPRFHCRAFADVKGSAASFNIPLASIYTPLPRCFQILFCPCLRSAGAISDSLLSGLGAAEQLLLHPWLQGAALWLGFLLPKVVGTLGATSGCCLQGSLHPQGTTGGLSLLLATAATRPGDAWLLQEGSGLLAGSCRWPQELTSRRNHVLCPGKACCEHNAASSACPCCEGASWGQAGTCLCSSGRSEPSVSFPTSPPH